MISQPNSEICQVLNYCCALFGKDLQTKPVYCNFTHLIMLTLQMVTAGNLILVVKETLTFMDTG